MKKVSKTVFSHLNMHTGLSLITFGLHHWAWALWCKNSLARTLKGAFAGETKVGQLSQGQKQIIQDISNLKLKLNETALDKICSQFKNLKNSRVNFMMRGVKSTRWKAPLKNTPSKLRECMKDSRPLSGIPRIQPPFPQRSRIYRRRLRPKRS